jgi:hypothetical protein
MPKAMRIPFTQVYIGRYLSLLISILLIFLVVPFLEVYVRRRILLDVIISIVLISAIYSVSRNKHQFVIGSFIALTAFALRWIVYFEMIPSLNIASDISGVVFFAYAAIVILFNVFAEKEVTSDVINGAGCVYLLLGLMWAFAYAVLESIQPGSFQFGEAKSLGIQKFIYYSFVTAP